MRVPKVSEKQLIAVLLAIGLLLNISWSAWNFLHTPKQKFARQMDESQKYPYLAPRIFVENPNDTIINFVPLREKLNQQFNQISGKKSFYFEYLPAGTSINIGGDQELIAASLIKVPLVMNLYKAAELGKINLDKQVTIQESELDDAYGNLYKKGAGAQISLREAAQQALIYSDNTATHVIFDNTQGILEESEQSLSQLDIKRDTVNNQAVINAKSYSSVLKSLYLSSYLSRDHSTEIITYLTRSKTNKRLSRNLPETIKVAEKNGVFNQSWSQSDCGIVYAPKRPYVICVMVELPEEQADTFIADVSKQVYDYVISQSKK